MAIETPRSLLLDDGFGALWVGGDRALGDLQGEAVAGEVRFAEELRDLVGQGEVVQVAHGEVDGDVDGVALVLPAFALGERLVEYEPCQRLDQCCPFCRGYELDGADQAARRVLPAHERFDPY